MAGHITQQEVEQLVNSLPLPPIPQTLIKLNKLLENETPELSQIAIVIQADIALSGLVLKVVNSSFFGLKSEVVSITHATNLLGIGYVVNIVTGLVLKQTLENTDVHDIRLYDSQNNIANLTAELTKRYLTVAPDEGYMLGLFHNSGHILIAGKYPDYLEYLRTFMNNPDKGILQAEQEKYNFDHTDVGYFLARAWRLPKYIREIIRDHHVAKSLLEEGNLENDVNSHQNGLMAVLKLAEHADRIFSGIDHDYQWSGIQDSVLGYLNISDVDYKDLLEDMLEKLETDGF